MIRSLGNYVKLWYLCSRRYFGLARIISTNQDDLSYSTRNSFPGSRNWVSCQTQSLWLNNAVQCRRPIGRSSIAAAAWTHGGTYLIYGFLAPISDQGIPVEYELDIFNTPHTGTTLCHPQNWLCRCDALFRSRHLALSSPLGHFNGDNARLSPNHQTHKTHGGSKVSFLQQQTRLSLVKNNKQKIPQIYDTTTSV